MNTDRFKFRVWVMDWKEYDNNGAYLSTDGELLYPEDDGGEFGASMYPVGNNYVIEQCTGLKDKNGKLIYEGDVIAFDFGDSEKCYVAWNEVKNFLDMYYLDELPKKVVSHFGLALHKSLSIVGNIHEEKWGIEK